MIWKIVICNDFFLYIKDQRIRNISLKVEIYMDLYVEVVLKIWVRPRSQRSPLRIHPCYCMRLLKAARCLKNSNPPGE